MICSHCGYNEEKEPESGKFVGIFSAQNTLVTTNGDLCGIYGCPRCKTVQFTTDVEYINKRKNEYKNRNKK